MELHRILNQPDTTLATVMTQAFNAHAEQTALMFADGNVVSYQSLANLAYSVATGIDTGARIGILASRSISAYSSILGAVLKGASYVPLNPRVPASRMAYKQIAKPLLWARNAQKTLKPCYKLLAP